MNDKLRPCPFCGNLPRISPVTGEVLCNGNGHIATVAYTVRGWNTRPIEDKLLEALKHFVNSDWTSDEEYFEAVSIGKAAIAKAERRD